MATVDEAIPTDASVGFYGFDTPRIFANQVQVLQNDTVALIVFREIVSAVTTDPNVPGDTVLSRNVASIVLPTPVAKALNDVLTGIFSPEPQREEA